MERQELIRRAKICSTHNKSCNECGLRKLTFCCEYLMKELLEEVKKQDKYRWHDLRENPWDLPDTDRDVEIIVNAQFSEKPFHQIARSADKEGYVWEISGQLFYETLDASTIRVIAWREIELFEEGE